MSLSRLIESSIFQYIIIIAFIFLLIFFIRNIRFICFSEEREELELRLRINQPE